MIQLFNALVGSQAHGLAGPDSDYDYRGVFVVPTSQLLRLGAPRYRTHWEEGEQDNTSWEIAWFLELATKCNPTILETFRSPQISVYQQSEWGPYSAWAGRVIELFPSVWNSKGVYEAFRGYGASQRNKFLDDKDGRAPKYATAYLRTLYNAVELLTTGDFHVDMTQSPVYETLRRFKRGEFEIGEVIQVCADMEKRVEAAYHANPNKQTDFDAVDTVLSDIRKGYWS